MKYCWINGSLDTIALRKAARLSSPESESRFNKALDQLMADFKVLPVGTTDAGGWHYSYLYDTVSHFYPDLAEQARAIHQNRCQDPDSDVILRFSRSVIRSMKFSVYSNGKLIKYPLPWPV